MCYFLAMLAMLAMHPMHTCMLCFRQPAIAKRCLRHSDIQPAGPAGGPKQTSSVMHGADPAPAAVEQFQDMCLPVQSPVQTACKTAAACLPAAALQVRALQSTPFKSDPEHFSTMTKASINLCRAYMASAYAGQGGLRDLSAARIHLRGVLKQCEDSFEGTEQYLQMQALLQEVLAAEDSARSLKRASIAVA